ncbi:hypothetical protein [Yinghuangia sp. YIM S09857]|uniref:hypothetical protein n=1 Tax=Yinghuangia sp. YIM S09857 TaxID=3436929 RepID=UPI003F539BE8
MNGNPAYHAVVFAVVTLVMLPPAWAAATGRLPRGACADDPARRRHSAWGLAVLWLWAPLNALPRIADVGTETVAVSAAAAVVVFPLGLALSFRGFRAPHRNGDSR